MPKPFVIATALLLSTACGPSVAHVVWQPTCSPAETGPDTWIFGLYVHEDGSFDSVSFTDSVHSFDAYSEGDLVPLERLPRCSLEFIDGGFPLRQAWLAPVSADELGFGCDAIDIHDAAADPLAAFYAVVNPDFTAANMRTNAVSYTTCYSELQ